MENDKLEAISWEALEHEDVTRDSRWYMIVGGILVALVIILIAFQNYLFAGVIFIAGTLFLLLSRRSPDVLHVEIDVAGIEINGNLHEYRNIEQFAIVYKPAKDIYRLLFLVKGKLKSMMNIPVSGEIDPNDLGEFLGEFVEYNPELKETFSDQIAETLGF